MSRTRAEIVREYGPLPGAGNVAGVSCDGRHVWFASGDQSGGGGPSGKVRAVRRPRRSRR